MQPSDDPSYDFFHPLFTPSSRLTDAIAVFDRDLAASLTPERAQVVVRAVD